VDERTSTSEQAQAQTSAPAALPPQDVSSHEAQAAAKAPALSKALGLDAFTLDTYDFLIRAKQPLILPPYKGATLRGGFGHAFRRIACALRYKTCPECLLRRHCIYSYIFETPMPAGSDIMPDQTQAPRPYVLEPPQETRRDYEPGETIRFGLVLIGRATSYLPYFIYAFEELGNLGIGRGKGTFELLEVRRREASSAQKTVYQAGQHDITPVAHPVTWRHLTWRHLIARKSFVTTDLHLRFTSPTRIVHQGSMVESRLSFAVLLQSLVRRIAMLSYFHCDSRLEVPDWTAFTEKAANVTCNEDGLRWYDWERYSNRQQARIQMGGLVGDIVYQGDFTPFWPYLALGEQVHVGKGGSFGLGRYEFVA